MRASSPAAPRSTGCPAAGAGDEPVEDGEGVERSGRSLRVVLDGLDREDVVAEPLDRSVVQVDLADVESARGRQRTPDDLDLVILGGYLDGARGDRAGGGARTRWR